MGTKTSFAWETRAVSVRGWIASDRGGPSRRGGCGGCRTGSSYEFETAAFCVNNIASRQLLEVAAMQQREIPGKLAMIGF